jgi:hypothetical protein
VAVGVACVAVYVACVTGCPQSGPAVPFRAVDTQMSAIQGRGPATLCGCAFSASRVTSSGARTACVRAKLTRGQERGWAKEPGRYLFCVVRVRRERVAQGGPRKYACIASEHYHIPHGFKPDLNPLSGPKISYQKLLFLVFIAASELGLGD